MSSSLCITGDFSFRSSIPAVRHAVSGGEHHLEGGNA